MNSWDDGRTIDIASAAVSYVRLMMLFAFNVPGLEGVLKFMKEHGR